MVTQDHSFVIIVQRIEQLKKFNERLITFNIKR